MSGLASLGLSPGEIDMFMEQMRHWEMTPLDDDESLPGTQAYVEPATEPAFQQFVHPYGNAYGASMSKRALPEPEEGHLAKKIHAHHVGDPISSRLPGTPLVNQPVPAKQAHLPNIPVGLERPLSPFKMTVVTADAMPPPTSCRVSTVNSSCFPVGLFPHHDMQAAVSSAEKRHEAVSVMSRLPATPLVNPRLPVTPATLPATPVEQRLPLTPLNANLPANWTHLRGMDPMPLVVSEHDPTSIMARAESALSHIN